LPKDVTLANPFASKYRRIYGRNMLLCGAVKCYVKFNLKVYEIEVFVVHDDVLPVAMILVRNAFDALQLQLIQRNSDYGKMSVFDNNKFDLTTSCASLFYNTIDNKICIDIKEGQLITVNSQIEQWMNDMDYLCAGFTTELNTNL